MVKAWKDDHWQPDPYAEPIHTTTSKNIKLQLANKDAVAAAKGQLHPHDMSPAAFLQVSLELEDLQHTLCLRTLAAKGQMTIIWKTGFLVDSQGLVIVTAVSYK
ncbi:hypothetical protein EWM64_g2405 [Hericium alpestre]|uniref:Uncharacterized protein n=1 Tax=Hericium alpestre TaxID=135208 RepID=A0A4Z0A7K1_9AGAM|nr:hypothetical protein EWM64_g2405 [Hericium alpestre]